MSRAVPRSLAIAVAVAVVTTSVAIGLKAWCGVPASGAELYLGYCYSDIPPLFFVEQLDRGAVPYLDHPVEYPVLTGGLMWLAAAPVTTASGFLLVTGAILVVAAAATAALLAWEVGPLRALAFAAAPTLAVSGAVNWDLPAVALATAAIVAHRRGSDGWAGTFVGLGAAAKLYPGLLLLPLGLAALRLRGRRAGLVTTGAALGAWAAVNVPIALAAPAGWWRFVALSRDRPVDWDSLLRVAGHLFGWWPDVAVTNVVSATAFLLGAAVVVAVMRRDPPRTWHLASLPLVAWFLLTSKVYSPQFSLWLLPLLALAWPGWAGWAVFAIADVAVTLTRFPYLAGFVDGGLDDAWGWGPFGAALVVRAAVLGVVAWVGWRRSVATVVEEHALVPAT